MEGRVAWLHVAPIKALAIESRDRVYIGPLGVEGDRRFCIVETDTRKMINAKRIPLLVAVRPELSAEYLTLDLPNRAQVRGEVALGDPLTITIFDRPCEARTVTGPFSAALTQVAQREVMLVRLEHEGEGVDRFDGGGAASLLSEASLAAIAEAGGANGPVDPRRFRMLVGVSGVPAHAEDDWIGSPVQVGNAVLVPKGNVGRCAVTSVDPDTGKSDFDTLAALAKYRGEKVTTEKLPFGVWARVAQPGAVAVGDLVRTL